MLRNENSNNNKVLYILSYTYEKGIIFTCILQWENWGIVGELRLKNDFSKEHWLIEKEESSRKTSTALLTRPKPMTVWITINYGKFWKRWEFQTTLPASWETCMQVKKQQLEPDMKQQTGSKLGKE